MANLCLFLCFVCSVQLCRALAPEAVSEDLLQAIRCVESNGDVCAIGDNGRSIGAYQIMRGYYDDALEFSSELRAIGKGTFIMIATVQYFTYIVFAAGMI